MGILYDYAEKIEQHIRSNHLDVFKTRGAIAMRSGFIISLIKPDDPDDSTKIELLRKAAEEVLGIRL
ncbi:MAG: hypothetical protein Q7W51_02460 [Coriobacteriia bacterium]|nr:hypothetical protein [Coriobacteriia bacterium]